MAQLSEHSGKLEMTHRAATRFKLELAAERGDLNYSATVPGLAKYAAQKCTIGEIWEKWRIEK